MKKLLLIILFLIPLSNYAQESDDWYLFGNSSDKSETYYIKIDMSNTTRKDVSLWLKTILPNKNDGYVLQYMVIHCDTKTLDSLDYIKYNSAGVPTDQDNNLIYDARIVPDSLGEALFNFVCVLND